MESADVIVVGAGIIGAACAEALSAAGLRVLVVDRRAPADATTASGEGDVLVSDKPPGPRLDLGRESLRRWPRLLDRLREELGDRLGDVEWDPTGGLAVATTGESAESLAAFAARQREAGLRVEDLDPHRARELEPLLTADLTAAARYPDDARLQPVPAATAMLAAVRARGGEVRGGVEATGLVTSDSGAAVGVRRSTDGMPCGAVVNACGPWAGRFSIAAGAPIDVVPRHGTVLVTAPLPERVRHKVYDCGYVEAVSGVEGGVRTSPVVESTRSGSVLIGSSRRFTGFDDNLEVSELRALARGAVRLFPALARATVMSAYGGFRPWTPDRLPVIGADPRVPGLWHAAGHEGAGIGLAAATGRLLADLFTGAEPAVDPRPYRVDRPEIMMEVGP
ncbi:NAD(P)/FAD-dependent oxidoreductase [Glycomyces xiaoerkulensis]|uniref:NAD(P)/FAD-dependent oxidoreductase n=1 Tax=Glycomyces xiaoerkulensis TaxID=2038139 RepID=UPI000C259C5F